MVRLQSKQHRNPRTESLEIEYDVRHSGFHERIPLMTIQVLLSAALSLHTACTRELDENRSSL